MTIFRALNFDPVNAKAMALIAVRAATLTAGQPDELAHSHSWFVYHLPMSNGAQRRPSST